MRKLILFLIIGMFLVSFASALSFDNIRYKKSMTFNGISIHGNKLLEKYNPIEIKNAFGLGSTLFEGYLSQHNNTCEIDCQSTIEIKTESGILAEDIKFETLQKDGSWIKQNVRNYHLSYWGKIDDYKTECKNGKEQLSPNGTSYIPRICNQIKTGSHYGWINYQIGKVLPRGIYKLKLNAQKKPSRTVDWKIKTEGIWLNSWATWGSIAGGDQAEVILNSPADGSTAYSYLNQFNASANVTGGATLVNMSLWTNETGSWGQYNTTSTIGSPVTEAHGATLSATVSDSASRGMEITMGGTSYYLTKIIKNSAVGATRARLRASGGSVLNTATFVGNTATFSSPTVLSASTSYGVEVDNNGAGYTSKYATALPISGGILTWTAQATDGVWAGTDAIDIESLELNSVVASSTQTWNRTISDGIIWNVQGCDSDGDCGFATSNYSLTLDSSLPIINVENPTGLLDYGRLGNETLNVTFTDTNLGSCWYDYNGTNQSIDGCQSGVKNSTTFNLALGNYNMTLWANDTLGNYNSTFISWNYKVLENAVNYSSPIMSGALDSLTLNLTYNSSFSGISVLLNYNGTNYSTTTTGSGYTRSYTKQLTIPSVTTQANLTLYFIVFLSNSTGTYQINTNKYNQTINPFLIDNCSSYTKTLMNFTMVDEDTLSQINGTIEIALNIYSYGTTNLVSSYNNSFNYLVGQESKICLDNITKDYTMSYQIRHYGNESIYFKKYKNLQRTTLNNNSLSQNITLYNLKLSRGYSFVAIVTGNLISGIGNTGLLVDVQRQYLSQNKFISIEGSVTNSEGNAVIHLVQNDEIYNFIVSSNGVVLGSFNNYQVKCANPSIGDCTITLSLSQSSASMPEFTTWGNITQVFLLDTTTNTLYQTFTSADGLSKTVRGLVLKTDNYGNNTICNNTLSGTSGTLICNIPTSYQNNTISVQTFVNGDYIGTTFFTQGTSPDWKGADILILLLMFSALTLLFIGHPIFTIVGSILGLVLPMILISVAGASFGTLVGSLFYYIAGGVIIIILMNKKK